MRLAETTNGKIAETLSHVDALIGWADADAEHATENDAPDTARDDRRRARALRKARALIAGCVR